MPEAALRMTVTLTVLAFPELWRDWRDEDPMIDAQELD